MLHCLAHQRLPVFINNGTTIIWLGRTIVTMGGLQGQVPMMQSSSCLDHAKAISSTIDDANEDNADPIKDKQHQRVMQDFTRIVAAEKDKYTTPSANCAGKA
jgi:hypothetical protein